METLSNLAFGFGVALTWQNIIYCFIGCFLGTLVGVLPGIGPVATVAMLLPFTFGLGPAPALIMLAGIYYGAQYGGSTTAILVNIPGELSAVVTTLDGHQMARRGRAGPALGIAAIGSFIAGCIATLVVAFFAPLLAEVALKFGPADYFSLMVFGLIAAVVLARGSLVKAIAMVCFGILLGLVGTDVNSGVTRFAFGWPELTDGIGFVALAMAFFGITDVVLNLERDEQAGGLYVAHRPRAAEPRRPADVVLVDHAGHRARLGARRTAGRRRAARLVRGLYAGEEGREAAPDVRGRRYSRRGGAGKRQQCGRTDLVHPDADARNPVESHHGADDRGADDPGHRARPAGHDRAS